MGLFRFDERPRLWFWAAMTGLAAALMCYAQTLAFTGDESFHLVAAQMIKAGFRPYLDFCFPQAPLNAYWNALWIRVLPESWRTVHVLASLETSLAVAMAADFVYRRWEPGRWRLAAAVTAGVLIGSNIVLVEFGTLGQAYGICLLLTVAAFRATIAAVRGNGWFAPLAGALAAGAAACSLLNAPVAPVLLAWMLWNCPARQRWLRGIWFVCAAAVPFAPVIWLFARAHWVVWFNLAEYHLYYRQIYWPHSLPHDIGALTAWLEDPQATLLGVLAAIGLIWLWRLNRSTAPPARSSIFAPSCRPDSFWSWLSRIPLFSGTSSHSPLFLEFSRCSGCTPSARGCSRPISFSGLARCCAS